MTIRLENNGTSIIMEQAYKGGKVKITVKYASCFGTDRIWVNKDDANNFYLKKINDGFKRA